MSGQALGRYGAVVTEEMQPRFSFPHDVGYWVEMQTQLSTLHVRKGLGRIPFLTSEDRDRVGQVTGRLG